MLDFVKDYLSKLNIELVGAVSLADCKIVREYKLKDFNTSDLSSLSAVMIAVPYLTRHEMQNISSYAIPRDYHLFFKQLFDDLIPKLNERYPDARFQGFADNSPIDEINAAATCGLGMLGDNGMLITEKYSSYVFLGEIITDYPIECGINEIKHCLKCGKCQLACPMGKIGKCLSALTQKKGELDISEIDAIRKYGSAWGCDICQEVCPYTLHAKRKGTIYTEVDFFKTDLIPRLNEALISTMSDDEFAKRAYSWRGRNVITRNLKILEHKE